VSVSSSWTGGRRKLRKKPKRLKTLVVVDSVFFRKRDKRGHVTDKHGYSDDMLAAVQDQFDLVVVFEPLNTKTPMAKYVEESGSKKFSVIKYETHDIEKVTSLWKTTLVGLGATFKRVRNPREITYMNLDRYMLADHITWVGPDDHKKIKIKLDKIKTERALRRTQRKRSGFYTVSIIGYTNAGKSTLLNKLTDKEVIVNEKMFSTISTLTGRITKRGFKILLTDTVGFIEDLPPWLIEAFKSTLEEITHSDIILLVVDVSNDIDEIRRKMNTCYKILSEMDYQPPVITVLNKLDSISTSQLDDVVQKLRDEKIISNYVAISARDGLNLERLRTAIFNKLPDQTAIELIIPKNDFSSPFINWLYENTLIIKNDQLPENKIYLKIYSPESELKYIQDKCEELDANFIDNK